MGFGFVAARFGLFLQALQIGQPGVALRPYGPSFWFGTGLILMGVLVNMLSTISHIRLVRELRAGGSSFNRPSRLAIAVAVTLAVFGVAMAIYVVLVREPPKTTQEKSMTSKPESGIVTIPGHQSVDATVQKLEGILQAKGIKLFALVDHGGEAAAAGLKMPATKLLIFGNPKAGTPVMLASPGIALDLPLKILVAEDADGKVWITYNSPEYLQVRHGLSPELVQNIAGVEALATAAAQ
jgi:uncharacterized protein (DUF302 family)/uncharacterized membrane protein YidH (DUF202 family)